MKRLLFAFILSYSFLGCSVENINVYTPVMYSDQPEDVLGTSAKLGGGVVSDAGSPVTEFGFVYSEHENPTIEDHKVVIGQGINTFQSSYELFEPSHTYYFRTYGINQTGVGYSPAVSFTTSDEVPCVPEKDNFITYYWDYYNMNVALNVYENGLDYDNLQGFGPGNLQFYARAKTWDDARRAFTLQFKETDKKLPKTGVYTTVDEFEFNDDFSENKVKFLYSEYDVWGTGAEIYSGQKIYVRNENGVITFIFCNITLGEDIINGTFTYTP